MRDLGAGSLKASLPAYEGRQSHRREPPLLARGKPHDSTTTIRAALAWRFRSGHDVPMRTQELHRLDQEIRRAGRGPVEAYVEVLNRAVDACEADPSAAAYLDVLELHSELADSYDRLGMVEHALRHADALVEHGYRCEPDPRCRRAEILTRHGRLDEAAEIWEAVAADTPDDVWLYNNAGLEYGAIGEHELALSWLTRALEVVVRCGDRERLLDQLRDLRAESLAQLGLDSDELQNPTPPVTATARWKSSASQPQVKPQTDGGAAGRSSAPVPVALAWLPAAEYAADVARQPARTATRPPGRNKPCWCGSGRKYKKCCGATGVEGFPQ
jgi:hypothetical protein